MKKLLILATLITLAGCGGGNSLTGSSASKLPNVAGVYAGTLHVDVDNSRVADGRATLTVNQSRASRSHNPRKREPIFTQKDFRGPESGLPCATKAASPPR